MEYRDSEVAERVREASRSVTEETAEKTTAGLQTIEEALAACGYVTEGLGAETTRPALAKYDPVRSQKPSLCAL